jgi:hypothetical protein
MNEEEIDKEFSKLWKEKNRYVLVKRNCVSDYSIIDITTKTYVIIEIYSIVPYIIQKMKENNVKEYEDIKTIYEELKNVKVEPAWRVDLSRKPVSHDSSEEKIKNSSRPNIDFLREQLYRAIDSIHLAINDLTFNILLDQEEKQALKTNMDVIMYHYALPKQINKILTLEEVCNALVTGKNEMPLWIKLKIESSSNVIILSISKRFRKKKEVANWHKSSEFYPVIIEK